MPNWIRIPLNGKSPITRDWPNADGLTDEQAQRRLESGQNIGVLCGERSGRLLVLDYDDGEPRHKKKRRPDRHALGWMVEPDI